LLDKWIFDLFSKTPILCRLIPQIVSPIPAASRLNCYREELSKGLRRLRRYGPIDPAATRWRRATAWRRATRFVFFAASGGLMSYGTDVAEVFRRAAAYVDRILKGDSPGELPLAVDVQSCDRSAFRDAIKVLRECSSCLISARQLHMPRRGFSCRPSRWRAPSRSRACRRQWRARHVGELPRGVAYMPKP
jgi:hypothetical protein